MCQHALHGNQPSPFSVVHVGSSSGSGSSQFCK